LRILLTGATGFTGRHFAQACAAVGHETAVLQANLLDAAAVAREVAALQPDLAVHLAAISFVGHADERAFYDVNLFGTLHLVEALRSCGSLQKVLVASSANVYGNSEHSPIAETEPPAPVNHYATSKAAMEFMVRARAGDLPLVITRPFNYTGTGQAPQFVIPKLVDHFHRRAPIVQLGNIDVEREYNDVRMLCAAYLRLLEPAVSAGTYNVCTGQTYTLHAVLDLLRELTGHDLGVEVDPRLVRANEIHRLCGDPARLRQAVGPLPAYTLSDTLSWMLSASAEAEGAA
jgi:GDP-6-deoxy-D-talose 4-dehydrogenase